MEVARVMMQTAGMSTGFWEFAVATATHFRNLAPSRANSYDSSHEQLFKTSPDLAYLWIFDCLVRTMVCSRSQALNKVLIPQCVKALRRLAT